MKFSLSILLLFFVFSFLFKTDASFDQDLGRHIRLGEMIVKTHQVPGINLFSYTNPDFPFINTHWLFEVLMYGANQTIGLHAVLILKILTFLLSVWLILKIIPNDKQALLLPVGFIFLHVLRERSELRPEIFSFLFTAATYFILEKFIRQTYHGRYIFVLPLIQLIWINTHIYFFIGLVLQIIFLISCLHLRGGRLKLLIIIFILSVLASLINPNGIQGLLYPLNVTANYGYTIVENQTMLLLESINFRDPNFLFVKLTGAIILISIFIALLSSLRRQGSNHQNNLLDSRMRGNDHVKNIILAGFGLVLALINVRSFPYLVLISLPAVLANFPSFKFKGLIKILTFITIPILLLESFFYLNGDYYRFNDQPTRAGLEFKESGKKALDFVLEKDLPQPIFNNFDIGSYIIYRGYPKYHVFVDGRPEAYPKDFFLQTYIPVQSDYVKFKDLEKQTGFKTIIFSHTDQTPWSRNFLQNIVKDTNWSLVYIDDFMLILVKEGSPGDLKPINLAELNVGNYNFSNQVSYLRMGIFLLNIGNQTSANQFLEKAYQLFPQSPILTGKKSSFFW